MVAALMSLSPAGCIEVQQSTTALDASSGDVPTQDTANDTANVDIPTDGVNDAGDVEPGPTRTVAAIGGLGQRYLRRGRLAAPFEVRVTEENLPGALVPLRDVTLALHIERREGTTNWEDTAERCTTASDGVCTLAYTNIIVQEAVRFAVTEQGVQPGEGPTAFIDATADIPLGLATGPNHSCLYTVAGQLFCWGWNGAPATPGQNGPFGRAMTSLVPAGAQTVGKRVPVPGEVAGVAVMGDNGDVGSDQPGQRRGATCITMAQGAAGASTWCTGSAANGLLGSGSIQDSDTWVEVQRFVESGNQVLGAAIQMASGGVFGCAVAAPASEKDVWCWGAKDSGQLGPNAPIPDSYASRAYAVGISILAPDAVVSGVATGARHACATLSSASTRVGPRAYCWGSNEDGQFGPGYQLLPLALTPVAWPATQPVPCLPGTVMDPALEGNLAAHARIDAIAAGGGHTCATVSFPNISEDLAAAHTLACSMTLAEQGIPRAFTYCSGRNGAGQRGQATTGTNANWVMNDLGVLADGYIRLAAGHDFTCGVTANGNLHCWGANSFGQLGMAPDKDPHAMPMEIALGTMQEDALPNEPLVVKQVAAGPQHVCVIAGRRGEADSADSVRCWGRNDGAQAGGRCADAGVEPGTEGCWAAPTRISFD